MPLTIDDSDTKSLLCALCKELLSCGPVIIKNEKQSICGRCFTGKEKGIRNRFYEIAAKNLMFPCRYRIFGCRETQSFAETYNTSHEFSCEFKPYKCMLWDDIENECNWINLKSNLVEHCQIYHSQKLIYNCCILDIDPRLKYTRNYLLTAFEMEYLFYVKVIITEKNTIGFRIEFLGQQNIENPFQYIINIKKGRSLITKLGHCKVEPQINEIEIENLKDLFDGLDGITFHLTIYAQCSSCHLELLCGKLYRHGSFWICKTCTPNYKECTYKYLNCKFKDHPLKIGKHEEYFCNFSMNLIDLPVLGYGKVWKIKSNYEKCAISTDIGYIVCEFTSIRDTKKFEFFIYSPLRIDQRIEFQCQVYVGNSFNGESVLNYPKFQQDRGYDWYVSIERERYPSWGAEISAYIEIQRLPTFTKEPNQLFT